MFEINGLSGLSSRSGIFIALCTTACLISVRAVLKRRHVLKLNDSFSAPSNLLLNRLRTLGGAASLFVGHLIMEEQASLLPYAKPGPDALSPLSPWLMVERIISFFTLKWFRLPSESNERERFFTIQALSHVTSWITSYIGDSFFWRYWFVLLPALIALSISTVALVGRALATKFDFIGRIPALVVKYKHAIRGMILAPLSSAFLADSFQFYQMNEFSMCCAYAFMGMACAAFTMEDFDPARCTNRWTQYLPSIYLFMLGLINLIQDGLSLLFLAAIVSCWATSVETNIFPHPYSALMQLFGLVLFPIATQGIVIYDDAGGNLVFNLAQIFSVVLVVAPIFITDKIEQYLLRVLDMVLVGIPEMILKYLIEPVAFKFIPFIYRKIRYGTFFSRMAKRLYGKFIKPVLSTLAPVARFVGRTVMRFTEMIASWMRYAGNKLKLAAGATAKGGKAIATRVIHLIRMYLVDPTVALAKKGYNEGIVPLGNIVKRCFIYLFEQYIVPVIRAMRKRVILFANLFALYLCLNSSMMNPHQVSSLMSQFIFCFLACGLWASAFGIIYFTKKQGPHPSVFWALFNIHVSICAMIVGFMSKGYLGTSLIFSLFNSLEQSSAVEFDKDADSCFGTVCITIWLIMFRDIVSEELTDPVGVIPDEHLPELKSYISTIVRVMWLFNLIQQLLQQVNSTRVSMNFAAEYVTSSSVDSLVSPYYVIARHAAIGMFTILVLRFLDPMLGTRGINADLDRVRHRLVRRNHPRPGNMTRWEWIWEFIQTAYLRTAFMDSLFILSGIASFPFPDANFFAKLTLLRVSVGYIQIALGMFIYAQNAASPRWKSMLSRPWLGLMWFRRVLYYYSRPILALGTSYTLVWSALSKINELRATGTDGFTILWGGFGSIGQLIAAFQFLSVGVMVMGEITRSNAIKEQGSQMFDKILDVVRKMVDMLELLFNFSERISRIIKILGTNLLEGSLQLWRGLFKPIFQGLAKGFTFIWSNAAASWVASVSTIGLLYLFYRNGFDEAILSGISALFSMAWNFIPSWEPISTTMGVGRVVGQVTITGVNLVLTGTKQWLFDLQDGKIFQNNGFVWTLNTVFYAIASMRMHRTGDAGYLLGPLLTLTISIMFFKSSVFAILVGCMVWGMMGVIVTYVDRRERRLAQEQFNRMHRQPNKAKAEIMMDNLPKESDVKKIFKSEECAFCYEKLDDQKESSSEGKDEADQNMQVSTLPCGHQFHHGCVQKWFESSNRCPICREPADQNQLLFQSMF